MRIDAYSRINQVYGVNGKIKTNTVSKSGGRDSVEISGLGKVLQTAKQAVLASSDVREDKVAELKTRIENGTYEVSPDSFADKLLSKYDNYNMMG